MTKLDRISRFLFAAILIGGYFTPWYSWIALALGVGFLISAAANW
jgi:hypothetical protein